MFRIAYPVTTTKKSMMFQMLRRYEPRWQTKPRARILRLASTQNIPRKYISVDSSCWARMVLSCLGRCSSRASTTQFAMMVIRTAYSNGGHSIMKRVCLRMQFSSLRIKRDVGGFVLLRPQHPPSWSRPGGMTRRPGSWFSNKNTCLERPFLLLSLCMCEYE